MIKNAYHVIGLGPGGGEDGELIVAAGTPEEVKQEERSHTGRILAQVIGKR